MSDPAINNASAPDSFLIQKAGGYRLRTIRLVSWAEFHHLHDEYFLGLVEPLFLLRQRKRQLPTRKSMRYEMKISTAAPEFRYCCWIIRHTLSGAMMAAA
jgi:hypothetical protein